ncbi:MAG: hypothetical protein H7Y62_14135, partial [Hyphomicrobium sp.]|nr:hypothetical protein [Hyphomicrobium sp.]
LPPPVPLPSLAASSPAIARGVVSVAKLSANSALNSAIATRNFMSVPPRKSMNQLSHEYCTRCRMSAMGESNMKSQRKKLNGGV